MAITQKFTLTLPVLFLFFIVAFQTAFAAKIYKWTDDKGNVHYSDKPDNKNQNQQIKITPGPSKEKKEAAKQHQQQLKSTADTLEKNNQEREQKRSEEQKKRDDALAAEKAKQNEVPEGQNDNYYPGYPRRALPPNYPRPRPPIAVPLPSGVGVNPGGRAK